MKERSPSSGRMAIDSNSRSRRRRLSPRIACCLRPDSIRGGPGDRWWMHWSTRRRFPARGAGTPWWIPRFAGIRVSSCRARSRNSNSVRCRATSREPDEPEIESWRQSGRIQDASFTHGDRSESRCRGGSHNRAFRSRTRAEWKFTEKIGSSVRHSYFLRVAPRQGRKLRVRCTAETA